jgi:hypothetical protein
MSTSEFRYRPTPEVGGDPASLVVLVICRLLVLMQL